MDSDFNYLRGRVIIRFYNARINAILKIFWMIKMLKKKTLDFDLVEKNFFFRL